MSSTPREPEAKYANVFRVGYNAFEFLVEFGQPGGRIHTAIYMSPQHAKMFSDLLLSALKDEEAEHTKEAPMLHKSDRVGGSEARSGQSMRNIEEDF